MGVFFIHYSPFTILSAFGCRLEINGRCRRGRAHPEASGKRPGDYTPAVGPGYLGREIGREIP